MIQGLQDFTTSLPEWAQWVGVTVAGGIPFVESYGGSVIGVVAGIPAPVAIVAAVVGNIITMLAFVLTSHSVRERATASRTTPTRSARRERLRRAFDRFGVPGVSLIGQTFLPSQLTSAALVSFGAPRNWVILWQIVSIVLWGTVFGILASYGIDVLRG